MEIKEHWKALACAVGLCSFGYVLGDLYMDCISKSDIRTQVTANPARVEKLRNDLQMPKYFRYNGATFQISDSNGVPVVAEMSRNSGKTLDNKAK
jgi:hypothetical protein